MVKRNKIALCTVFDSGYLSRATLCVQSLNRVSPNSEIFLFCLDEAAATALDHMNLPGCIVVRPEEYECSELSSVKPYRSKGEYAWTVKPYAIGYVFQHFQPEACAYVDADLFFYSDPQSMSLALLEYAVVLTPHNYAKSDDSSEKNGVYSAQFLMFKNSARGNELLDWWRGKCFEWCFAIHEPGKFGDQKYLEVIAEDPSVCVWNEHGFVGPWNVARYKFSKERGWDSVTDTYTGKAYPVLFYHFHGMKILNENVIDVGGYSISDIVFGLFYSKYCKDLYDLNQSLMGAYSIQSMDDRVLVKSWKDPFRRMRNWIIGRYKHFNLVR